MSDEGLSVAQESISLRAQPGLIASLSWLISRILSFLTGLMRFMLCSTSKRILQIYCLYSIPHSRMFALLVFLESAARDQILLRSSSQASSFWTTESQERDEAVTQQKVEVSSEALCCWEAKEISMSIRVICKIIIQLSWEMFSFLSAHNSDLWGSGPRLRDLRKVFGKVFLWFRQHIPIILYSFKLIFVCLLSHNLWL